MRNRFLIPYLFILLTLCLLGWAGIKHIDRPTLGLYWNTRTGLVYQIQGNNPNLANVRIGDRLLSGNGIKADQLYAFIDQGGEGTIHLLLERAGVGFSAETQRVDPDFITVLSRLSFVFIALVFWLTGTLIYIFGEDREQSLLFLFFCLFTSVTLAAGSISSFGPAWSKALLYFGIVWGGFFAVHLHLNFPGKLKIPHRTVLLAVLFTLSSIQTISYSGIYLGHASKVYSQTLWPLSLLLFAGEMSFVVVAVAKSFRNVALSIERIQAGIIVLATILGIFPVLVFSVIPEVFMGRTLIPYEFSFLSLLSFPFGYQYAILRLKLVNLDSTVNRGAAFTFVILILAGLYALVFSLLSRYFSIVFDQYPLAGMLITIVIAFASRKLYSKLFTWVNHILYGEWYDYRSAINFINHHLKSVESEDRAIATTFCQVVMKSLQLDFVAVILQDHFFTYVETGSEPVSQRISDENFEAVWKQMYESEESSEKPNDILLDPILPKRLLPKIHLITPFRSQDQMLGLLILGRKRGDGIFEKSDLEVLDVAIHQAQISMEKAGLLNDVRQYSDEIRELHRKVTDTREQERKQVSRELHDEVIQSLVGLNYRLSTMRRHKHKLKEDDFLAVQEGLVSVLEEVRQICANLRPPVLDSLDLVSAYRVRIDEVQRKSEFQIRFFVHGDKEQDIPEDVRGVAYRLLGESLANIRKHANAKYVDVHLSINATEITIIVEDDGQGFSLPNKLSSLERSKHFGLVSLLEDVRAVKGTLEIDSTIGEGCCLVATIPLTR